MHYSVDSIIEQQLEVLTTRLLVWFMMLPFPLTNELEVFNNKELVLWNFFAYQNLRPVLSSKRTFIYKVLVSSLWPSQLSKVNNTVLGRKFDKIPFLNWNIVTNIYEIMDARSFWPSSMFSILGKLTLQFIFCITF